MIILVDDDSDQRLVLRLVLEQAGYTVREAANGSEALVLQRKRPAQFLITDIFMPEADGFEVIDSFLREFPQTKIIVVSGGGQRVRGNYLKRAEMVGVAATFQKPFPAEALIDKLRALSH